MKNIFFNYSEKAKRKNIKLFLTGIAVLGSAGLFAAENMPAQENTLSLFANPLFNTLLGVIILLLIVISVLGGALVSVAESNREKEKTKNNFGKMPGIILLLGMLSAGKSALAQDVTINAIAATPALNDTVFYLMILLISLEMLIIIVLLNAIRLFTYKEKIIIAAVKEQPSLIERLNASVSIEKEQDIMLDHNYDGIRELDNDLPPWWKYGFYLTIVFAVCYFTYYHVLSAGELQIAEYNKSILVAKMEKAEFEKNNAENVNETTVTMLTDKVEIVKGENIFKETCFACHGKLGEGGVGPNLTDDYWLHGGSIKDIFATIKYGWPDKGMKSWQADLSPVQIHEIASYIKTIRGTNPPSGKAAQGDLFVESGAAKDSVKINSVKTDSLKTNGVNNVTK